MDRLDVVDVPTLAWWLAERQLPSGGLNGRPEKLPDVNRHLTPTAWFPISSFPGLLQPLGTLFVGNSEEVILD